ncbi:hypothetical protein QQP08_001066 [Theobroma cacao]|nr:hypothetical protein QQP08_001066 [Theobroma cacao]
MQDAGRQQVLSLPGVVFQGRSIVHLLLFSSPPIHVSMMLGTKIRGLESAMEKSRGRREKVNLRLQFSPERGAEEEFNSCFVAVE